MLWCVKDLTSKDRRSLRVNIEYDHATLIRWSPDGKAFIIHKAMANAIEVYKVTKKPDGFLASATKALEFPKVCIMLHLNWLVLAIIKCSYVVISVTLRMSLAWILRALGNTSSHAAKRMILLYGI